MASGLAREPSKILTSSNLLPMLQDLTQKSTYENVLTLLLVANHISGDFNFWHYINHENTFMMKISNYSIQYRDVKTLPHEEVLKVRDSAIHTHERKCSSYPAFL